MLDGFRSVLWSEIVCCKHNLFLLLILHSMRVTLQKLQPKKQPPWLTPLRLQQSIFTAIKSVAGIDASNLRKNIWR
jgi:hypothetical protein